MKNRINFTVIGGGSVGWMQFIMRDVYQMDEVDGGEIRLVDPRREYAEAVAGMLRVFNRERNKDYTVSVYTDREEALPGSDFVATTFSPGTMDAFVQDLELPVRYGIRLPVSMTVGIPGISAAIRTVPVAYEVVQDMERLCPGAWLLNVTNPMTCVTSAMNRAAKSVRVIGMCHEFHCADEYFGPILGLDRPEGMDKLTYLYQWLPEQGFDYTVAGINHFIWLTKATLKGEDMLPRIREYCATHDELDIGEKASLSIVSQPSNTGKAKFALCRQFGYLPLCGDRHLIEFYPSLCNVHNGFGMKYNVKKTTVDSRIHSREKGFQHIKDIAAGKAQAEWSKSGEEMVELMRAILCKKPVTSLVNMPNEGQISNMPKGAVVETFATVSDQGVVPMASGELPGAVGTLCRLHWDIQDMVVRAALDGDRQLLVEAMSLDPAGTNADFTDIPKLCDDLLMANKQWLPRFFR